MEDGEQLWRERGGERGEVEDLRRVREVEQVVY